ncbi:hypothetical protein BH09BAC1_BH09BAC1_13400 [soil metagenome]
MRPVEKGPWPTFQNGNRKVFNQSSRAAKFLIQRTGDETNRYCHLCEMQITNAPAVEHIKPEEHFPRLANHWDNFLLICSYCNARKRDKIPTSPYRKHYYWPHINNTFMAFKPSLTGVIEINQHYVNLPPQIERAQNLIDIYQLDAIVGPGGGLDIRFAQRLRALNMAIERKRERANNTATIAAIIDMATTTGFLSIWLMVFDDIQDVKQALINCPVFHLAETNCFDVNYNLVPRIAGDL